MRKIVVTLNNPDKLVTWRRFDKNLGFKSPLPHLFSKLITDSGRLKILTRERIYEPDNY